MPPTISDIGHSYILTGIVDQSAQKWELEPDSHAIRQVRCAIVIEGLVRCLRSETASLAIMVDAKDDAAISFYERHEFLRLPDQANRLFKPMAEIEKLFGVTGLSS